MKIGMVMLIWIVVLTGCHIDGDDKGKETTPFMTTSPANQNSALAANGTSGQVSNKIDGEWLLDCAGPDQDGDYLRVSFMFSQSNYEYRAAFYSDENCTESMILAGSDSIETGSYQVGESLNAMDGTEVNLIQFTAETRDGETVTEEAIDQVFTIIDNDLYFGSFAGTQQMPGEIPEIGLRVGYAKQPSSANTANQTNEFVGTWKLACVGPSSLGFYTQAELVNTATEYTLTSGLYQESDCAPASILFGGELVEKGTYIVGDKIIASDGVEVTQITRTIVSENDLPPVSRDGYDTALLVSGGILYTGIFLGDYRQADEPANMLYIHEYVFQPM